MPNHYDFIVNSEQAITTLEVTDERGNKTDPLENMRSALAHLMHPPTEAIQLDKELMRYPVTCDQITYRGQAAIDHFKTSPKLYGLEANTSAEGMRFVSQNFKMKGESSAFMGMNKNQKGTFVKEGDIYSYIVTVPVYTLEQNYELAQKMTDLNLTGHEPDLDVTTIVPCACKLTTTATIDLSNREKPVFVYQIKVESDNPDFSYHGPENIREAGFTQKPEVPKIQADITSEKIKSPRLWEKLKEGAKKAEKALGSLPADHSPDLLHVYRKPPAARPTTPTPQVGPTKHKP